MTPLLKSVKRGIRKYASAFHVQRERELIKNSDFANVKKSIRRYPTKREVAIENEKISGVNKYGENHVTTTNANSAKRRVLRRIRSKYTEMAGGRALSKEQEVAMKVEIQSALDKYALREKERDVIATSESLRLRNRNTLDDVTTARTLKIQIDRTYQEISLSNRKLRQLEREKTRRKEEAKVKQELGDAGLKFNEVKNDKEMIGIVSKKVSSMELREQHRNAKVNVKYDLNEDLGILVAKTKKADDEKSKAKLLEDAEKLKSARFSQKSSTKGLRKLKIHPRFESRLEEEKEEIMKQMALDYLKIDKSMYNVLKGPLDLCWDQISKLSNLEYSFIANIGVFLYQLFSANSKMVRAAACYQFCSILNLKLNIFTDLSMYVVEFCTHQFIKAEALSDDLSRFIYAMESVVSSELLSSLHSLILGVVSYKVLDKDITKQINKYFGKVDAMPVSQFIPVVMNAIVKLLKMSEGLMAGLPLSDFLFSRDPIQAVIDEGNYLLLNKDNLYRGVPVEGKMYIKEFIRRMQEVNTFIVEHLKVTSKISSKYSALRTAQARFLPVLIEVKNLYNASNREMPYAFILTSPPGCGKSEFLVHIFTILSLVRGREFKHSHCYHRVLCSEFWEMYNGPETPIVHYSELGNMNAKIIEKIGDAILQELNSLIDRLPYPVNQAALEKKGKVLADPEIVGIDTNNEGLHAKLCLSNPAALERRLHVIRLSVLPEYQNAGGGLDPQKSFDKGGNLLDRYLITMVERVAHSNEACSEVIICQDVRIDEFDKAIVAHYKKHIAREAKVNQIHAEVRDESFKEVVYYHFYERFISSNRYIMHKMLDWMLIPFFIILNLWWIRLRFAMGKEVNISSQKVKLYNMYFPYIEDRYVQLGTCIALVMPIAMIIYLSVRENHKVMRSEAQTDFILKSDDNTKLNDFEEKCGCTNEVKRVSIKDTPLWNAVEPVVVSQVSRNSLIDITRTISKNVKQVIVKKGSAKMYTYLLGIKGTFAIINRHAFNFVESGNGGNDHWILQFTALPIIEPDAKLFECKIYEKDLIPVTTDVVMFKISHYIFSDITSYFSDNRLTMESTGFIDSKKIRVRPYSEEITVTSTGRKYVLNDIFAYDWENHDVGDCGKPLISSMGPGFVILGIHSAGDQFSPLCFGIYVLKNQLDKALQECDTTGLLSIYSEARIEFDTFETHKHSPFRYEKFSALRNYGSFSKELNINNKSLLIKSILFNEETKKFFNEEDYCVGGRSRFAPPAMKPFTRDEQYFSPWNHTLRKMDKAGVALDKDVLLKCINLIVDRVPLKEWKPLTLDAAINGISGDVFSRRINVHTASGIGFSGKKEKILPVVLEAKDKITREPTAELKRALCEIIDCYERGECAAIYYKASLKDEARPIEKVDIGNTRVFYAGPTPFLILCRMFLMPIFTDMVENGADYCTAVGIDMHRDTPKLVEALEAISRIILEGDFSNFDIKIPFEIRWACITLIYFLCKKMGYGDFALRILIGILSNFMNSFIFYLIDIIKAFIQHSGSYGTAEFNSLCMLLILMYIWYSDPVLQHHNFFEHVALRTYGDDFIASVSPFASTFFNNFVIKQKCKEYFDMDYTPAGKGNFVYETLSLSEASFLKRRFVYRSCLNRYVSPLSKVSIARMLTWYIPSSSVSREKQFRDTAISALWEYFFHCETKNEYNLFRMHLLKTLHHHFDMSESEHVHFPTWEYLIEHL